MAVNQASMVQERAKKGPRSGALANQAICLSYRWQRCSRWPQTPVQGLYNSASKYN